MDLRLLLVINNKDVPVVTGYLLDETKLKELSYEWVDYWPDILGKMKSKKSGLIKKSTNLYSLIKWAMDNGHKIKNQEVFIDED